MAETAFRTLRHVSFRKLIMTRFMSSLSVNAQAVALGWHVYDMTGSALYLGLVGLAQFLPSVALVLVSGIVADRLPRRTIMSVSLCIMALCSATFTLVIWLGLDWIWLLFVLIICSSSARAFLNPAQQSLLPSLVPPEQLGNAVTINSICTRTAQAIGPVVGGLIYAVAASAAFGVVAFTFMIAAVLAARIPPPTTMVPAKKISASEVVAGFQYIWTAKPILGAVTLDVFVIVLGGITGLLPVIVHDLLHAGPETLGALRAAFACGGMLAALFYSLRPLKARAGAIMMQAVVMFGLASVVVGLSPWIWLSATAIFIMGACDMTSVYIRWTLVQLWTPDEVRGRVAAITGIAALSSNDLGDFRGGASAAVLGVGTTVILGGISSAVIAAIWTRCFPKLASVDTL